MVVIIAGYDEGKTKDKAGLARWVGMNLILVVAVRAIKGTGRFEE